MTKRKIISVRAHLELLKGLLTKDAFNDKFELSMSLVSEMMAEDAMIVAEFTDLAMTAEQKRLLVRGKF